MKLGSGVTDEGFSITELGVDRADEKWQLLPPENRLLFAMYIMELSEQATEDLG